MDLRPWQNRFLRRALAPGVTLAALCLPRAQGKSTLAAYLAARALTPGDRLFVSGGESHLAAASVGQARKTTFRLLRELVESSAAAKDYRIAESAADCHVTHRPTNTRVSVIASSGKTSQGLVRAPFVFADEPGSWEVAGGELMADALDTARGKPGSHLRVVYIGTLAPSRRGWWHELVRTKGADRHIELLQADPERWDRASEIRRVSPLSWTFPESRRQLLRERDEARTSGRLLARFHSYRLNLPMVDPASVLLDVPTWRRMVGEDLAPAIGRPAVGVDLGQSRAWSAAVAVWPGGRIEARAVAPGIPDLTAQERRDRVPRGTYVDLAAAGVLTVDVDRRAQRPEVLLEHVRRWRPRVVRCDRFNLKRLQDAARGLRIEPVSMMPSVWAGSIGALRRLAADGPVSVEPASVALLEASLAASVVKVDAHGNPWLSKDTNNTARDDVAAAFALAAGAAADCPVRRAPRFGLA